MQRSPHGLVYSPQDLIQFVSSEFAVWMERFAVEHPDKAPKATNTDDMLQTLFQLGQAHEQQYLQTLQEAREDVYIVPKSGGIEATLAAMQRGHRYIYQAVLQHENFMGYADFLVKVDCPSSLLGDWSYVPLECKLALNPKPHFVIQAACYCHLLEQLQGTLPQRFYLLLGNGTRQCFATEQYIYYYHQVRQSFLQFMESFNPQSPPLPQVGDHGRWQQIADQRLEQLDHLSRVANITHTQIRRLESAGIHTLQQLAQVDANRRIQKLSPSVLQRLVQQARLQKASSPPDKIAFEVISPSPDNPRQGLALLPPASPLDVYFDIEGYPLADGGGLEYLFGATYEQDDDLSFQDWWAHDDVMEKDAFEAFMDWVHGRWQADPNMHIYHYAAYETIALKRLMGKYTTREDALDDLLRAGVFIDLYRIVRQGVCVGTQSYSIKDLEPLYECQRGGAVKNAQASVVQYFHWKQSNQAGSPDRSSLLQEIRDYNRFDCDSTKLVVDWLRGVQKEYGIEYQPPPRTGGENQSKTQDRHQAAAQLAEELLAEVPLSNPGDEWKMQHLFAHLLEFYRREDQPFWWQRFAWLEMEETQLSEQLDCLAGLQRTDRAPYKPTARSRSLAYEYTFDPQQETKLAAGRRCWFAPAQPLQGCTLLDLDRELGRAVLTVSNKALTEVRQVHPAWEPPQRTSLIEVEHFSAASLAESIFDTVNTWRQTGDIQPALRDFLERRPPRLTNHPGTHLILEGVNLLEGTIEAVANLDHSILCIQGPPGSGKTYTAARAILYLLQNGSTVAVTANSHKVINNLLERVARLAQEQNLELQGAKIDRDKEDPLFANTVIEFKAKIQEALPPHYALLGATAFQLCKPEAKDQWDYLFIDEAGQLSLANLVAIARCAQNLVLMGDQMQLEQPIQGTHPGESGQSALGYFLNGRATVPPDLGIFLDTSYRMHPSICRFISESVYEGRLHYHPDTCQHQLELQDKGVLQHGTGLFYLPVAHEGNSQSSPEEIVVIEQLVDQLTGLLYTNERGEHQGVITAGDILIVAPYNYQVRNLEAKLGDRARIGTVDKFQGQEAPVLIVSMCASSGETAPRGLDFLLNCNRLNVALSRAQCVSIVVGSPALAKTDCSSIKEIEQVNLFCKVLQA